MSAPNYNFGRLFCRPNLFQNRKWDGFQSVKLRQPYDFGRQLVVAGALAAVSSRRSKPDRRSPPDRLSPCDRFSASDRVSTPRRRSRSARLSKLDRLLSLAIDHLGPLSLIVTNPKQGVKAAASVFPNLPPRIGKRRLRRCCTEAVHHDAP